MFDVGFTKFSNIIIFYIQFYKGIMMETENIIKIIEIIAPLIAPIITGFVGIWLGNKHASSRIKQEINELEEKDKRTELRHKEEKFENAIQNWSLYGLHKDLINKYEGFSLDFKIWKTNRRNEHINWLKENGIVEINDFYSWMAEQCNKTGSDQSWIDFWKYQIK